jgi:hypothetical protein
VSRPEVVGADEKREGGTIPELGKTTPSRAVTRASRAVPQFHAPRKNLFLLRVSQLRNAPLASLLTPLNYIGFCGLRYGDPKVQGIRGRHAP